MCTACRTNLVDPLPPGLTHERYQELFRDVARWRHVCIDAIPSMVPRSTGHYDVSQGRVRSYSATIAFLRLRGAEIAALPLTCMLRTLAVETCASLLVPTRLVGIGGDVLSKWRECMAEFCLLLGDGTHYKRLPWYGVIWTLRILLLLGNPPKDKGIGDNLTEPAGVAELAAFGYFNSINSNDPVGDILNQLIAVIAALPAEPAAAKADEKAAS